MITETSQPITCFISMKSEILSDHAAPWARAPLASPRTDLTVTTHHSVDGIAQASGWTWRRGGQARLTAGGKAVDRRGQGMGALTHRSLRLAPNRGTRPRFMRIKQQLLTPEGRQLLRMLIHPRW
jgi:hypothetical protein